MASSIRRFPRCLSVRRGGRCRSRVTPNYFGPKGECEKNLNLMRWIDERLAVPETPLQLSRSDAALVDSIY